MAPLATLFSKVYSNKLRIIVKNKMTLIGVKFAADLINKLQAVKQSGPGFFDLPCRGPTYGRWALLLSWPSSMELFT